MKERNTFTHQIIKVRTFVPDLVCGNMQNVSYQPKKKIF